jgi:hypothetical protein
MVSRDEYLKAVEKLLNNVFVILKGEKNIVFSIQLLILHFVQDDKKDFFNNLLNPSQAI